ncbi:MULTISPECIES: hypothetical protein [Sinorhizobium]|uniref:hypothetical protein n=1 Tax=Sinorhizobium TaxID=28105 RepID=UPI00192D32B6|nr:MULTISPECIES: hypothetical protein [Sinorhizobium]
MNNRLFPCREQIAHCLDHAGDLRRIFRRAARLAARSAARYKPDDVEVLALQTALESAGAVFILDTAGASACG